MSKHFKALITVFFSLVMVMALGVIGLTACGEVDTACSHEFEWTVKKAASCTEEGLETEVCKICHEERNSRPIAKLAHEFQWQEVSASTCTVKGSEKQVCSVCGTEGETREKDLIAHTPAEVPVANTDGTHSYKCSVCGTAVESEPHTATYKQEAGTHQEVCSVCGYEMSTAAAHDFIWRTDKEPTCTETGLRSRVCNTCGYESQIDEEEKKIEKLEHNGGDKWYVDDETGHHYQICTMCKTERLNDGAHEKGDVATASETAGKHHYNCTVCNAEMEETDCTSDELFHAAENEHYNLCTVCGRQLNNAAHVAGAEWLSDYNGHYNACTSCGAEMNRTAHSYGDEDCTTCHYAKHLTVDTDYTYESVEGGLSIKSYNGTNAHIELPLSHDGQSVLAVSEGAFANNEVITSVVIPEGYFTLGRAAFQNATNLTYLSVPDSVDVIPNFFLQGCSSLSELVLPDELDDLGFDILDGCDSLTSFVVPKLSSYTHIQAFKGYTGDVSFAEQNIQTIGSMFMYYAGKHVTLPAELKEIGDDAFMDAANLVEIEFPKTLTQIGGNAFRNCSSLENVTLPNGITLAGMVFQDCTSLEWVVFEGACHIVARKSCSFKGCTSLKWVKAPTTVVQDGMFVDCSQLEWVYIPKGCNFDARAVVEDCPNFKCTYYGGDDVQKYYQKFNTDTDASWGADGSLFSTCPVYTYSAEYKAPDATNTYWHWKDAEETVPEIWEGEGTGTVTVTFHPRGEINAVSASAQQTSVGGKESTEYKMTLILDGSDDAEYDILVQVAGLEDKWYGEDYNYRHHPTITIGGNKYTNLSSKKHWVRATVGSMIFRYNDDLKNLPGQAFDITITLDINSRLIGVQIDAKLAEGVAEQFEFTTDSNTSGSWAVLSGYIGQTADVTIPDTYTDAEGAVFPVTKIGKSAFVNNTTITSVEIPASVTEIEQSAFDGCTALETIYGMDGVLKIGVRAFNGCSSLQSVYFPALQSLNVAQCFAGCTNLTSFIAPNVSSTTTSIGGSIFKGCTSLEYVDLGYIASVTTNMFNDNTVAVKNIVLRNPSMTQIEYSASYEFCKATIWFMGTEAQWNSVTNHARYTCHCLYTPYYHDGGWFFEEEGKPTLWTAENKATGDALVERDFDLTKNAEEDGYVVINYKGDSAEVYIPYEYEGLPVTELGENLFDSRAVTTIHLNDCLKKIGAYAFRGVDLSGDLILPETLEEICDYAFDNAYVRGKSALTVPANVTKLGEYVFTGIKITYGGRVNGFEGITVLPKGTFYKAVIDSFIFPEVMTELGESAFEGSMLASIDIPATVTKLNKYTFKDTKSLHTVSGLTGITEIPESAFERLGGTYTAGLLHTFNLYLPEGIKIIGDNAFADCNQISHLAIPASVTSVGVDAFLNFGNHPGKDDRAPTIYYGGADEAAWNGVSGLAVSGISKDIPVYYYSEEWKTGAWTYKDGVPYVWQAGDDPSLRYTTAKVEIVGHGEHVDEGYVFATGEGATDGTIKVTLSFATYMSEKGLSDLGWPNIGFKITYSSESLSSEEVFYGNAYDPTGTITFSGSKYNCKNGWKKDAKECKLWYDGSIKSSNTFTFTFSFDERGMLNAIKVD